MRIICAKMAIISAYMGPDHVEFIHFDKKSEAERLADPPYQKNRGNPQSNWRFDCD